VARSSTALGSLIEHVETNRIDNVIHFAAKKAVAESVSEPLMYYDNNLKSLLNLLAIYARNRRRHQLAIVFSSSCTVYGDTVDLPVTERTLTSTPTSPYGKTKLMCEQILEDVARIGTNAVSAVSLRYFNPIGAHPSGLIGELPIGKPQNIVPIMTQIAAGCHDMKELTIAGSDYETYDGTCIRDYIHVVDLAKAHVKALEFANKHQHCYEVFNLGSGKGTTVLELVNSFNELSNNMLKFKFGHRRQGDVTQIWSDSTKALELLGWSTERSVKEALLSAWQWQLRLVANQIAERK
jgi:UDP-glucose 4-epimerase